jgi:uroporphyrinogen decarboxylase
MTRKQVVIEALKFRRPPYVPWSWGPTIDCAARLRERLGRNDLSAFLDNHFYGVGANIGRWEEVRPSCFRDPYGVVWDRQIDKDIGTPCDWPIKRPEDLGSYQWPDASDEACYAHIPGRLAASQGRFCVFGIGFSFFERAWTMRGMENLLPVENLIAMQEILTNQSGYAK